jgi:hypothetical protein
MGLSIFSRQTSALLTRTRLVPLANSGRYPQAGDRFHQVDSSYTLKSLAQRA